MFAINTALFIITRHDMIVSLSFLNDRKVCESVELGRNMERKYLKISKSTYYRWRKEGKLVPRTGPGEDLFARESKDDNYILIFITDITGR